MLDGIKIIMAFKKNSSLLITGGTGFIGSHTCVSLIEDGFEIIVVDSNINSSISTIDKIKKSLNAKKSSLTFFRGDVRDVDFLHKCVAEFPDRFRTMVPVDEWDVKHNVDKILEKLVYSISELNLHAIKFHTSLGIGLDLIEDITCFQLSDSNVSALAST